MAVHPALTLTLQPSLDSRHPSAKLPLLITFLRSKPSPTRPKCSRVCASSIGLYSHQRARKNWAPTFPTVPVCEQSAITLKGTTLVLRASVFVSKATGSLTLSTPSLIVAIFFVPSFSSAGVCNSLSEFCVELYSKYSTKPRLETSSRTGQTTVNRSEVNLQELV